MEAAKKLWGYTPQSNELPDLRSSSDFAWGFWDFAKQGEGLGDIRKIFSMYITNKETLDVIDKVATMQGVTGVGEWPGVEVDAKMEQGLALIGRLVLTLLCFLFCLWEKLIWMKMTNHFDFQVHQMDVQQDISSHNTRHSLERTSLSARSPCSALISQSGGQI